MAKPTDCIPVTDAETFQKNWNDNQAKDIKAKTGADDVIAVTFNLQQLSDYIEYIKTESKKYEINNPGIRVYFGAKSSADGGKATVFFCPSKDDTSLSDNIYDIDPLNKGNGGYPPSAYKKPKK